MINKLQLQSLISKYHLGALIESTKWEIKDKTLTIKFMSPTQDMLGKVTYNSFPLEDCNLAIFNTTQLLKLLSVTQGDLILETTKINKITTKLNISDSQFNVNYALADIMMIRKVASIEEPSDYSIEINLEQEHIAALIKSKNAVGDDNTLIIESSIDMNGYSIILFTFGENTEYSNKITYSIPVQKTSNIKLPFSSEILKGILNANKDMLEGTIFINNEGLMKMSFSDKKDMYSEYFLVRKADL
jgi:hypothetical protein